MMVIIIMSRKTHTPPPGRKRESEGETADPLISCGTKQ